MLPASFVSFLVHAPREYDSFVVNTWEICGPEVPSASHDRAYYVVPTHCSTCLSTTFSAINLERIALKHSWLHYLSQVSIIIGGIFFEKRQKKRASLVFPWTWRQLKQLRTGPYSYTQPKCLPHLRICPRPGSTSISCIRESYWFNIE